ncbi:MAG: glycosyltransferase family 2 protein [Verrucomicrobiota bacterium]
MSGIDLKRVQVIIPALNERETIADVIKNLHSLGLSYIRVVDNGSIDETDCISKEAGAEVIHESKMGYGQACWSGMKDLPEQIEWILFCDGDGSDDLGALAKFFDEAQQYDFVLGNRLASDEGRSVMTPVQRFGSWLAGNIMCLAWGKKFHDLGPLRLIKRETLDALKMEDRAFGWTVEMQAKAASKKILTQEVDVAYFHRKGGKSKIAGTIKGSFLAGSIILGTLGKLIIQDISQIIGRPWLQAILTILVLFCYAWGSAVILPVGDFRFLAAVPEFLKGAAIMGLGFVISWGLRHVKWWLFWLVVLGPRIALLWMYPGDDIWRYIWEGMMQHKGINPYELAPSDPLLEQYHTEWWGKINNRETTAIYPPLSQLIFKGLAMISSTVFCFKLAVAIADIWICAVLAKRFGLSSAMFYAWNPLPITMFAGGGHYDSLFVICLVVAWLIYENKKDFWRWEKAVLWLGASVAIKWITLPVLAFVGWRSLMECGWKRSVRLAVVSMIPFLLSWTIVCWGHDPFTLIPVDFAKYARSAEFIPYFLGLLWKESIWKNELFIAPLCLAGVWIMLREKDYGRFTESWFFLLLIFSPLIHAWYFTWMIPFAVYSRNLGVRLVSLSVFVYFFLQHRQSIELQEWLLEPWERVFLWAPFVLGFIWSRLNFSSKI